MIFINTLIKNINAERHLNLYHKTEKLAQIHEIKAEKSNLIKYNLKVLLLNAN